MKKVVGKRKVKKKQPLTKNSIKKLQALYEIKPRFLSHTQSDKYLNVFKSLPELAPKEFTMFTKTVQTPRRMGYYSDTKTPYGYGKKHEFHFLQA